MNNKNPKLEMHAPSWKFDLPAPNDSVAPNMSFTLLDITPNHIDEMYLEFPVEELKARGYFAIVGTIISLANLYVLALTIHVDLTTETPLDKGSMLLGYTIILLFWPLATLIRMDLETPQYQPIRFNRLRRKIYVYRFHFSWFYPFSKTKWEVRPAAYNWDDLHAEASSIYGPMGTGGLKESISLCALKPGTLDVVDRFHFAGDIFDGERYWAIIRLYMQQGPEALPPFSYEPRDWDTNPVCRWAPKVQWPADMDLESRTAPAPGDAP
ncbi:DUF6708 domain-containing protein [Pseudomonas fontis]|uniref:DUF6708 domain-containing protein n=1 Tax=Pseudomonas fontis TaxID=2942633 RepID=A0ABT5NR60_9PSED|nr:DUF6708 domain-containing protein [Pseudomonas fontis]MDD0977312.1 hypothetical protein [Pseudomonas fontis]MDD0990651.1 hypothetical protein [Pseudomonas fontis]